MAERTVETIAGSGTPGYMDGVGNATAFSDPQDVAIDGNDVIYVFDRENTSIRRHIRVDPEQEQEKREEDEEDISGVCTPVVLGGRRICLQR